MFLERLIRLGEAWLFYQKVTQIQGGNFQLRPPAFTHNDSAVPALDRRKSLASYFSNVSASLGPNSLSKFTTYSLVVWGGR